LSISEHVLSLADRCVKCGLCLPHCPTYGDSLDEAESPRGRIALLQGVAEGALVPDAILRRHLDTCLGCRRCERVCPADVAFERLMDTGRQLPGVARTGFRQRLALRWLGSPTAMRRLHGGLRRLQRSGLLGLVRKLGLLRLLGLDEAVRLLPPLKGSAPLRTRRAKAPAQTVGLLIGCLGHTLEAETAAAAVQVLEAFGFGVKIIDGGCCGALAWHRGETALALAQARAMVEASDDGLTAIVHLATGCGTHLVNYGELPFDAEPMQERARAFAGKVVEITDFLARQPVPAGIWREDAPVRRIAVHTPCSQVNGLRLPDVAGDLLSRVPGLQVHLLPGNDRCCGAGGDAMLRSSAVGERLRGDKLEAIATLAPDAVVSTNPGCALYLNAGLGHDQTLRVVHPVVVMAERLQG